MNTNWLDTYRNMQVEAREGLLARREEVVPQFVEPASFGEAVRAAWMGENWFGRMTSEDIVGTMLYRNAVSDELADNPGDDFWTPANESFEGVEQYRHELLGVASRREFLMRREGIRDRVKRIERSESRNGMLHHAVALILDPTILVGYGTAKVSMGLPAMVVGARVAAVETAVVGASQGYAAARYEDRTAMDAVKMAGYAGVFSFFIGTGIGQLAHGKAGRAWGTGVMDFRTRQTAAASRMTAQDIIETTVPNTVERTERLAASYAPAVKRVDEMIGRAGNKAESLAQKLGRPLAELTPDELHKMYQTGDKATRNRVTRLRKYQREMENFEREKRLLMAERGYGEAAKDADAWKTNLAASLFIGRRGLTKHMLPRVRATEFSKFEVAHPEVSSNLAPPLAEAHDTLRTAARQLTRSHGLDDAPGKMAGASVEDYHLREITQLFQRDEELRTMAIAAMRGRTQPGAMHHPVARNITNNVFRWGANKVGELPAVMSGGRWQKYGPFISAEDELETIMHRLSNEALAEGGTLKLDHITDIPDAVKELFSYRQGEYMQIGKKLRDANQQYMTRMLNDQISEATGKLQLAKQRYEKVSHGDPLDESIAFRELDWAQQRLDHLNERLAAYKAADDPLYQPISLLPFKVRANRKGFVDAAEQHFRNNPVTEVRQRGEPTPHRFDPNAPDATRGRAEALWHATVHRVDQAGRPVGRAEFMRKIEGVLEDYMPGYRPFVRWFDDHAYLFQKDEAAWREALKEFTESLPPEQLNRWQSHMDVRYGMLRAPDSVDEFAYHSLERRLRGLESSDGLATETGGRYLQSEMFSTARLDPKVFTDFIENRPTVQWRAYMEREVRRTIAARTFGDPDARNPMLAVERSIRGMKARVVEGRLGELLQPRLERTSDEHLAEAVKDYVRGRRQRHLASRGEGPDAEPVTKLERHLEGLAEEGTDIAGLRKMINEIPASQVSEEALTDLAEKLEAYDLLRRQMMGEVLFEGTHAFIDNMNHAVSLAANISTSADLGMAGYSVTIDIGQMLAYYGMGPVRLVRLARAFATDQGLRKAMANPALSFELGVAGEIFRGARLRSIQGADMSFGNQPGFVASGNYWSDMGQWITNFYAEGASNVMTASLLNPITDLTQKIAAPLATTKLIQSVGRVVKGIGDQADINALRRFGVDSELAGRIWAQFEDGDKVIQKYASAADDLAREGVVILPKFSTWADPELAENVMAMIAGDIRVASLHPGIGANRIWKGWGGSLAAVSRLYYLFTRWAMVSQANVYGKNIEDRTYQHAFTGMAYSTAIQMMVNWAKEPDFVSQGMLERAQNAMVMGGGLGYLGIMNERLERLSGHTLGLRPAMGLDTFAHDPDSLQFRMAGLGPVTGKAGAVAGAIEAQQYGRLMRLMMPYQNWWLWNDAVRQTAEKFDVEE